MTPSITTVADATDKALAAAESFLLGAYESGHLYESQQVVAKLKEARLWQREVDKKQGGG